MKCTGPYVAMGGTPYPCGRCLPCRISNRRIWKTRILLEKEYTANVLSAPSQFITLTYNDDAIPMCWSVDRSMVVPTLYPQHVVLFMKKLRKAVEPMKFRMFLVGEYGGRTARPHYHFGAFGFPACRRGRTLGEGRSDRRVFAKCCDTCRLVGEAWQFGDIEVRDLGSEKCEYLARYVTKKMTKKEDPRLDGRFPEFSRPSRRPGVGVPAVQFMAQAIRAAIDPKMLIDAPCGPDGGKGRPVYMGRLLHGKLREELGIDEVSEAVRLQRWSEKVGPMFAVLKAQGFVSLSEAFSYVNAPYEKEIKARMEVWEKGVL